MIPPLDIFKLEPDGKYANAVKVALGRSSVSTIEIKDGLKPGELIVLLRHLADELWTAIAVGGVCRIKKS